MSVVEQGRKHGTAKSSVKMSQNGRYCKDGTYLDFDQQIVTFDSHPIHRHGHVLALPRLPCLSVEFPAMPRAHDLLTHHHSLPKRTAPVEANIIHGSNLPIHPRNTDGLPLPFELLR